MSIDAPRTLASHWAEFEAMLSPETTAHERWAIRGAFYAGAGRMFEAFVEGPLAPDKLRQFAKELDSFVAELVELGAAPRRRRAVAGNGHTTVHPDGSFEGDAPLLRGLPLGEDPY